MDTRDHLDHYAPPGQTASPPQTLGDVLYRGAGKPSISEAGWEALVHAVAAGEQAALHGLYERAHRMVFTLAVRITGNRDTAEEVTLDVFHDVWRKAASYHPSNGTVLGWIMNQARSRAIDRLRFEQRKKRVDPDAGEPADERETMDPRVVLELKQMGELVRTALAVLTPHERLAVEAAFFTGLTHSEIAARFNEPLGTIKTRIRSGLQKMRHAIGLENSA